MILCLYVLPVMLVSMLHNINKLHSLGRLGMLTDACLYELVMSIHSNDNDDCDNIVVSGTNISAVESVF